MGIKQINFIQDDKIFIRPFLQTEVNVLYKLLNNKNYAGLISAERYFSHAEIQTRLTEQSENLNIDLDFYAIFNKSNNCVGFIEIVKDLKLRDTYELGIVIADDYRNKGYASHAIKLCTNYLYQNNIEAKVLAVAKTKNVASINLFKKCGFSIFNLPYLYQGESTVCLVHNLHNEIFNAANTDKKPSLHI